MTKEEFEAKLQAKIDAGEITEDEAELEWLDWMHRDEVWSEW